MNDAELLYCIEDHLLYFEDEKISKYYSHWSPHSEIVYSCSYRMKNSFSLVDFEDDLATFYDRLRDYNYFLSYTFLGNNLSFIVRRLNENI